MPSYWKWACASVIGSAHARRNEKKQDSLKLHELENGSIVASVSDGAGSAAKGKLGSWLACRCLMQRALAWLDANETTLPPDKIITSWIDDYRLIISNLAAMRGLQKRDFAATLAFLVVGEQGTLCIHVGDSCMVFKELGDWNIAFWPENGEYASTTFFLTDNPAPRINIFRTTKVFSHYALFSDGINSIALENKTKTPFKGFFDAMFSPVDRNEDSGYLDHVSQGLEKFLGSEQVLERTDDDKSLILLSSVHED